MSGPPPAVADHSLTHAAPHLRPLVERARHDREHLVRVAHLAQDALDTVRHARRVARSSARALRWMALAATALGLLRCLRQGRAPSSALVLLLGAQVVSLQARPMTHRAPRVAPPPLR